MAAERNSRVLDFLIASMLLLQALTTEQNVTTQETPLTTEQSVTTQETPTECSNNNRTSSLDWSPYQDGCYSVSTDSFSYEAGKEFCRSNGGTLASVHSHDEMTFIISLVGRQNGSFWIGLRKSYPNEFQWEDETPFDYVNWLIDDVEIGYPGVDVNTDIYDSLDKCAAIRPPGDRWSQTSCDDIYRVICEFRKVSKVSDLSTTTPAGFCPEGWYTFGDSCYRVDGKNYQESKGWNDASSECEAIGSKLVSVHSSGEQDFLNTLMLDVRRRMWIGLSRTSSGEEFNWKDDSPLDYSNWNEGEPNNHLGTEENCVQLLERREELGKWNDAPCRIKFPYICKKPKDPAITEASLDLSLCAEPEGWLKIRGSCYKVYNEVQSRASWLQAQNACANSSAILASVKSMDATAHLRLHMTDMDGYFWIGIRSTAKHRYTWIGGAPLIYTNWERDQPKDVSDANNCVAINTVGEWMIRNCNESLPFICEVIEEAPEPPQLQPPSSNMTCPEFSPKWHDLGGKYCYIMQVQERVKWYEASCLCSQEGGYLASFHSTDEIDLIVYYLKDLKIPLHIGFERDRKGSFVWADGSPADFDNWNTGQPNSNNEQCAAMIADTGKWSDIQCSERHGYICSVLKVSLTEESPPPSAASVIGKDLSTGSTIAVATVCTLSVLVIAAIALYYYYPSLKAKISENVRFEKLQS